VDPAGDPLGRRRVRDVEQQHHEVVLGQARGEGWAASL
jgi:hypothetical protein